MQRDILFRTEAVAAAGQAHALVAEVDLDDLDADHLRRDALLWNFTVLGEAVSQVSEETKARFPNVPWRRPVDLCNRIVHGYWSIDLAILHTTATDILPAFIDQVRSALDALDSQP